MFLSYILPSSESSKLRLSGTFSTWLLLVKLLLINIGDCTQCPSITVWWLSKKLSAIFSHFSEVVRIRDYNNLMKLDFGRKVEWWREAHKFGYDLYRDRKGISQPKCHLFCKSLWSWFALKIQKEHCIQWKINVRCLVPSGKFQRLKIELNDSIHVI